MILSFLASLCVLSAAQGPDWVQRFSGNPIITQEMLPGVEGENINGPSLIRVPSWVSNPLGRYYLYFANHRGSYIRMAYADSLEGPWRIHEGGVLGLAQVPWCTGHLASPDVIVEEETRQIRLYFHGVAEKKQRSFVALSKDGLSFEPRRDNLGPFYFRVFRWQGMWYAMSKGGGLYRSSTGLSEFSPGPNPVQKGRTLPFNDPGPRHVALDLQDQTLWVYYSSIGDAPERIFRCRIDLTGDWETWQASEPELVLKPERIYEGADLPVTPSLSGAAKGRENGVRDPGIFTEEGRRYLLYSVAGESGIAIAELLPCE